MEKSIDARLKAIKNIAETLRDRDLALRAHELAADVERLREVLRNRTSEVGTDCAWHEKALEILDGLS